MAVRPIVLWPDPRLGEVCAPVDDPGALRDLAQDMLDTMYDAPGRGLAAPQIGVMQRIFVMDTGWKEGAPAPLVCVNPVITDPSETMAERSEGCLSIPGLLTDVTRPDAVTLRWTDLDGASHSARLTGFAATCAQHEMDHLDGRVTFDRLSPEARRRALTAWDILQQETQP